VRSSPYMPVIVDGRVLLCGGHGWIQRARPERRCAAALRCPSLRMGAFFCVV